VRLGTGASEKTGAFELTGGAGNLAIHVEGLARDAGAYRVGSGWEEGRKVPGSFNRTDSGSLGLSWVGEQGYLGVAYTRQAATYGLPGHNHSYDGCHAHGDHLHCGGHGEDDGHGHEGEGEGEHGHGSAEVPVTEMRSDRWDVVANGATPLLAWRRCACVQASPTTSTMKPRRARWPPPSATRPTTCA